MTTTQPHPEHDVSLALPRQWATRHHPAPGIVLVSRARAVPASGFRPELVVQSQPVDGDLDTWRALLTATIGERSDRAEIEDDDVFDLNGHVVDYRRFSHLAGPVEVVSEQWAWLVEGTGITLTCSVAREDYLAYGEVFEQVAETVDIVARAAA